MLTANGAISAANHAVGAEGGTGQDTWICFKRGVPGHAQQNCKAALGAECVNVLSMDAGSASNVIAAEQNNRKMLLFVGLWSS